MSEHVGDSHWLNWCRLCAKDDVRGNVKVYTSEKGQGTWDNVLVMAIRRYFEVHMRLEDDLSSVLCTECYTLISELIDFSEHVTKVQAIFEVLRRTETEPSTQLDVAALRQQYGLREDDWTHIIKPMPLPDTESQAEKREVGEQVEPTKKVIPEEARAKEPSLKFEIPKQEFIDVSEKQLDTAAVPKTNELAPEGLDSIKRPRVRRRSTDDIKPDVDWPIESAPEEEEEASSSSKRRRIDCPSCGKPYRNRGSYEKHLEQGCNRLGDQHKEKLDKSTTCNICEKTLSSSAALKLHKEGMHSNAKPFVCDNCGKQLKTITALNEHKLVHTEDRPFVCDICKAGFKNRARLKIHHQIHEEPSFVCNICGKKLQTRRTWNMHKVVHSEERKLKCEVCGALFKRSKTLKTHLLSHTGLRPYVCQYCGKTFACNANCRSHKLKKHPQEMEQEDGEGLSSRLSVPTLEELRVMTQKIPKGAA